GGRRLNPLRQLAEHIPNRPGGFEDCVHDLGLQYHFTVAKLVEQVFGEMAQGHQLGCVKKARTALDGVKAPEDVVEQALVVGGALQVDKLVVDSGKQVARLDQEILKKIFHS